MISAGEFRNGVTFELDGNVFQVVEFQHVKPGKGAAFVRTKLKNVITGGVVERTFRPTEKMPKAHIERKDMEYSYSDGDLYYFMDQETFELMPLNADQLGDALKFVKENMMVKVLSYKGSCLLYTSWEGNMYEKQYQGVSLRYTCHTNCMCRTSRCKGVSFAV